MRRRTHFRVLFAALALALVAAACGGEDATEPTEEAPEETPEATEEPAEEPEEPEEDALAGYPEGDIEVIVPFSAGGPADASARMFIDFAQQIEGVTMNALNIEGAGGVTGWAEFVERAPDGYTLTIATPPFNLIPAVMNAEQTPYTLDQFEYICTFANVPNAVYIRADEDRWANLDEVLEDARANPGQLTVAVAGAAGTDTIHLRLLEGVADVEFTQVPFDGGAPAAQALSGGQVDLMMSDVTWADLQEGALTMLAVAAPERFEKHPDVPTYVELGYEVIGSRLRTMAAPPTTDRAIIDYWSQVCLEMTETPEFVESMEAIGQPVGYLDPDDTRALVDQMASDIEQVVAEHNLGS